MDNKDNVETGLTIAFPEEQYPLGRLVSRKEAMRFLGVTRKTMLEYEKKGFLNPLRNIVNHRIFYTEDNLLTLLGSKLKTNRQTVLYTREAVLGSRSNKGNRALDRLDKQVFRMQDYCVRAGIQVNTILKDVGPVNGRVALAGHDKLIEMIMRRQVSCLVMETEDRLGRWGMGDLFKRFLEWHGVDLHIASPVLSRPEYQEELKQDLTEIMYEAKRSLGDM